LQLLARSRLETRKTKKTFANSTMPAVDFGLANSYRAVKTRGRKKKSLTVSLVYFY
jgi:hypothetical protein